MDGRKRGERLVFLNKSMLGKNILFCWGEITEQVVSHRKWRLLNPFWVILTTLDAETIHIYNMVVTE